MIPVDNLMLLAIRNAFISEGGERFSPDIIKSRVVAFGRSVESIARAEALEDAARVCEARISGEGHSRDFDFEDEDCAAAIRALIDSSDQQPKLPCPNCGKSVNLSNYGRCWHCGMELPREPFLKAIRDKRALAQGESPV